MKILGYILSLAGIIGLAYTMVPQLKPILPFLKQFPTTILTAVSAVLVLVGLFLIIKGGGRGGKQPAEVPIFSGKHVVGYRRN